MQQAEKKPKTLISQTMLLTFNLFFHIVTLGNFGWSPKFLYTQEHNSETKAVGISEFTAWIVKDFDLLFNNSLAVIAATSLVDWMLSSPI